MLQSLPPVFSCKQLLKVKSFFYRQLLRILWKLFLPSLVFSTTCVYKRTFMFCRQKTRALVKVREDLLWLRRNLSPAHLESPPPASSELLNTSRGRHSQPGSGFMASSLSNILFFYKICLYSASVVSNRHAEMTMGGRNIKIAFCILEPRIFKALAPRHYGKKRRKLNP